jgi:predicted Zn finger-like uncharacterized protein
MIITCPSCATRYEIPPKNLGPAGRMVRCTNCGHRWFVAHPDSATAERPAEGEEATPEGADSTAHAGIDSAAAARAAETGVAEPQLDHAPALATDDADGRTRRAPAANRSTAATIGWLAVLLVLLILTGLVLGRNELVAIAPQTAPVYQRVGLPVTQPIGLELAGIVSERLAGENGDTLRITGAVRNVAGAERAVPPLRIALLDGAREEVLVREVDVPQAILAAGASTRFSVDLENPPPDARNFSVTFAVPE